MARISIMREIARATGTTMPATTALLRPLRDAAVSAVDVAAGEPVAVGVVLVGGVFPVSDTDAALMIESSKDCVSEVFNDLEVAFMVTLTSEGCVSEGTSPERMKVWGSKVAQETDGEKVTAMSTSALLLT